ncbi:hypothetical protein ACFQQB_11415 [Nonomuraea rubra]|uniref:hypothetical protein n=1 Tax=Nonomuraea rubra TaxID=46180 RepID=UPI00361D4610
MYGAHGAGKTHAACRMMASIDAVDRRAVQFYLRFDNDDFVTAYRRLASSLTQDALTDLCLRYLGVLAVEWAEQHGSAAQLEEVHAAIRNEPSMVLELFDAGDADYNAVLEAQAREISIAVGDGAQFQRALSFLLRPEFSHAAYDWLCGRAISPGNALAMGVDPQLDDPQRCRYALQLLAALTTRGGAPFVLVLDQCEKFLLHDGTLLPRNSTLLQNLAETIPLAGGLLLLVCNLAGWDLMPPDLRQRLASAAHRLPLLTPHEAELLLTAYTGAARGLFTDDAVRELLRQSGGNVRRFLQLSWLGYERGFSRAPIGVETIARSVPGSARCPELTELAMLLEARLLAAGLVVERSGNGEEFVSFGLPDSRDPQVLITLSKALYADDHRFAEAGRKDGRAAFTSVLISGYASPPVLTGLSRLAHVVLVADGSPEFSRRLDTLVEQVAAALGRH